MARIRTARFQDLLRRSANIEGRAPFAEFSDSIVPSFQVNEPTFAEDSRLRNESRWTIGTEVTSAAAQAARVRLAVGVATNVPPQPRNRCAIIDGLLISGSVAGQVTFSVEKESPGLAASNQAVGTDVRGSQQGFPIGSEVCALIAQNDTPAIGAAGTRNGAIRFSAPFQAVAIPIQVILLPNFTFQVTLQVASATFSVFAFGRERSLEDSELA